MGNNPIRVVFVTTVFEGTDTGPGTYARYLWQAFRDDPDLEFHLVAPEVAETHPRLHASGRGGGPLALYRRVQEMGLSIARSSEPPAIVHGNATHSMGRFVGYPGPLLVQVNDYDVATFPRRALSILTDQGPRRLLGSAWRRVQEGRVLRSATLALCNSVYTANVIRHSYAIPADRTRVLHKAVDTAVFERQPDIGLDPMPSRPHRARLVFVGTDWQRKGLDVLLEALKILVTDFPELTLVVIGPDQANPQLKRLIQGTRLAPRVRVVGRISPLEVARHLWHADAFVLPSRREALGVAVLEAMAAGIPVVATRVGGIPEIVSSNEEALLVEPEDAQALARAVGLLLGDRGLQRQLAFAGRVRATEFSIATTVRAIKEAYLRIAP